MNLFRIATLFFFLQVAPLWPGFFDFSTDEPPPPENPSQPPSELSGETSDNATNDSKEHPNSMTKSSCHPEQLGSLSIAEWYNTTAINSFISYTKKFIHNNSFCFVHFNSVQDVTLWVAPFGFHSKYQSPIENDATLDFRQNTFGLGSGFEFSLVPPLTLGVGGGYLHSNLRVKEFDGPVKMNSIFLSPYLCFLFSQGYCGLTVLGVGNFYSGNLKHCFDKSMGLGHVSWNVSGRLEGGLDIELPQKFSPNCSLHPNFLADYLNVFEDGYNKVKARASSYLYTLVSLRFSKAVVCTQRILLLPSATLGWANWAFLRSGKLEVSDLGSFKVKGERKNQLLLGLSLISLKESNLLFGVDYEAFIGSKAPTHSGKFRVEWSW